MESGREKVCMAVARWAAFGITLHVSSDVLVQIVDARNPLLFRCEDLVSKYLDYS